MRTHLSIWFCLLSLFALPLAAQDMQRLSEPDIAGTARYVGMAGAMTAVGGDPSAIHDNPAALGVYRRYESSITLGGRFDQTTQLALSGRNLQESSDNMFYVPQASFVFAFGSDFNRKGLIYNNLSFSYKRLSSLRRCASTRFEGVSYSLAEQMASNATGIRPSEMCDSYRWENENIGWLSLLGYDTYMIDPVGSDSSNWMPYTNWGETAAPLMRVSETGYIDQFSISWGGNIDNRWFIGVGLNIRSLRYSKISEYTEYGPVSATAAVTSTLSMSGVGLNGSVGLMAQPLRWLRLGASFITPSFISTSIRSYGIAESYAVHKDGDRNRFRGETPDWVVRQKLYMPFKTTVGAAFIVGRIGLISLQYDYQHYKNVRDYHVLRVGTEWVIAERVFLNAGYAYTFIPGAAAYERNLCYNDVRTDTDWASMRRAHHIGVAVGYRGPFAFIQVGYRYGRRYQEVYPFATACSETSRTNIHDIVVTLGWHSAK